MNCDLFIQNTVKAISPPDWAGDRPRRRSQRAFTLVEMTVATSVSVFVLATLMVSFVVLSRSFSALGNYTDLDRQSRNTLDVMARDIRQAGGLTNWTSTSLSFTNLDGNVLNYSYDPNAQVLSYTNGSARTNYLGLTDSESSQTASIVMRN